MGGHEEAVRLLLEREDINPDMPSSSDQTLLLWAVQQGHEGVVKLLLGRKDVNPDRPGNDGRTPLWQARKHAPPGTIFKLGKVLSFALSGS